MTALQQIGDAAVLYCALIATASVAVHATVKPRWWTNAWGMHLMAYMFAIAWILDISAARVIAGATLDTPWYSALRAGSFAVLIPAVITWRLVIQAQARGWLPWQRRRRMVPD